MKRHHWIAVGLVLATWLAYGALTQNVFIRLDDPDYITTNPHVLGGFSGDDVAWAFNVGYTGNWHPLTWFSHMLDVSLWGLDPGGHHATNLALHAASAVLLFFLLRRMTGAVGRSAFVAAVFAVHPLHVESVAWAAERKDVLSTLLGFVALWCWVDWTKQGGAPRYAAALAAFAASLAAKPMFVTLPFLLLLLDAWPLARGLRVLEKLPFLALSIGSCILTVIAQGRGKAMTRFADLPLDERFANAASAFLSYLGKALWPSGLSVFYPHPFGGAPALAVLGGSLLFVAGTIAAFVLRRRLPWLATGWFWWVGMLVPVIGIVQVGGQSMADRYTYVPLVGLSIVVAWGVGELLAPRWTRWGWGLSLAAIGAWIVVTRAQVELWKDDETLFRHALAVEERNYLAHFRVGADAWDAGRADEAIAHYARAVELAPDYPAAHNNYGGVLLGVGRVDEAIVELTVAVRGQPDVGESYINLAGALLKKGRVDDAIPYLREGVRLRPDLPEMRRLLDQLVQSRAGK
jgi:tetratricopeptide (TPR) repeat protein